MTQPGTAGTSDDPLDDVETEALTLAGTDIGRLVALCFDTANQPTALRFDGLGSSSGFFDGTAVAVVNGSVKSISGAEYVDASGTSHTLDSWQRGSGTVSPIAWETASDWDAAVSEAGTVHESVANTDHDDATAAKMGYRVADPFKSSSLELFYPLNEDSGTTANDFSGAARDGNITGGTINQTGLLGTSTIDFGGSGDVVATGYKGITGGAARTVVAWVKTTSSADRVISYWGDNTTNNDGKKWVLRMDQKSNGDYVLRVEVKDGFIRGSTRIPDGNWHMVAATYPGGGVSVTNGQLYVDGVAETPAATRSEPVDTTSDVDLTLSPSFRTPWLGKIAYPMVFSAELTAAEIQTLYDVVANQSNLETATKSFATAAEPNLQNLSYSLNGQSIDLDIIGSPGTASEEVVTQSLGGSTSYSLTWSSSHTDFRVRPNLSTSDPTVTPTIGKIELVP